MLRTRAISRDVTSVRLTSALYARFGDVIAAPLDTPGRIVNQGTARRWDCMTAITNLRGTNASLNVSLFRCASRRDFPVTVGLLEKHPLSTQVFVPMNAGRYLVIVALGDDTPDLTTLMAFVASGTEGVSYRLGVWHHPMIALDHETDFACLVWEDGSSDDCMCVSYPRGDDLPAIVHVRD
jgi:ureidoglycolate lyase